MLNSNMTDDSLRGTTKRGLKSMVKVQEHNLEVCREWCEDTSAQILKELKEIKEMLEKWN